MVSVLRSFIRVCAAALLISGLPSLLFAQVTVSPDGQSSGTVQTSTSGYTANFTVTGYGYAYLDCWGTNGISCYVDDLSIWGATNATVYFSTSSQSGTGYLYLMATVYDPAECDPEWMQCDEYIDYGSRIYTIQAPNQPPTASFNWSPTTPNEGQSVSFNGSASSDPSPGYVSSYAWTFGDGGTGSGATPSHTYGAGSQYQVRLIVTDNQGAADTLQQTITVNNLAPSGITVADANPGLELNRSECVNVSVVSASVACDDFQFVYAFTPLTVLNRSRQLSLIYNRSTQDHAGIVAVNVEVPTGASVPDSICVSVDIGSASPSECYDDAFYSAGTWTRFALEADYGALSNTVDLLDYDATVTGYKGGLPVTDTTATYYYVGTDNSKVFGRGWWLGSYERLQILPSSPYGDVLVWFGGDQSYRVYKKQATDTWVAETRARPDTIIKSGSDYVRHLIGGGSVYFNGSGVHQKTVDRLGYETQFTHDGSNRPTAVKFTTPSAGTITGYQLTYTSGRLATVQVRNAAGTGWDTFSVSTTALSSGYKINSITSPTDATTSALTTSFSYASGTGDMTQVVEPGSRTLTVTYDHRKVSQVTASNTGLSSTYAFDPASTIGLVPATYPSNMDGVSAVAGVRTKFNGPRTDVADTTSFYTTGWGAARGVRDALGSETWIERQNGAYPALPTRVAYPNGWVVKATYDSNGLLYQSTDSSNTAVTTYAWNTTWSQPTQINSPEGVVTKFQYNGTTGNREWQAVASDTVKYAYNGYKQLSSITDPEGNVTTLTYDALGNLITETGPSAVGNWTHNARDGRGYATKTSSKVGAAARDSVYVTTAYDVLGRVRQTDQRTNTSVDSLMWLVTTNTYNSTTGVRTKTEAFGGATPADTATTGATEWFYDGLGRLIVEKKPSSTDTLKYDAAGNVTSRVLVGSGTVTNAYDVLNRVATTVIPNRVISSGVVSINGIQFPYYDSEVLDISGSTLTILGDSLVFGYDEMGNLIQADNRYARIRRDYSLNGALAEDSIGMRKYTNASDFTALGYRLTFTYNKDGQRTAVHHPSSLSPGNDSTAYAYSSSTGRLSSVTDPLGNSYAFYYNRNGQPDTLSFPGGYRAMWYDAGGRMTDLASYVTGFGYSAGMTYDPAGHILEGGPGSTTSTFSYNGFGHVSDANLVLPMQPAPELFGRDAFGRTPSSVSVGTFGAPDLGYDYSYNTAAGALTFKMGTWIWDQHPTTPTNWEGDGYNYGYDGRGNMTQTDEFRYNWEPIGSMEAWDYVRKIATFEDRSRSYYTVTGQLVAHQITRDSTEHRYDGYGYYIGDYDGAPWGSNEEYWYDALGRRILKRSRQESPLCTYTGRCHSPYERFVWDGDQILWETRTTAADVYAPNDTNGNGTLQGSIGYLHAGGIDQPVGLVRNGATFVLHRGWRGLFQGATNTSGSAVFTDVSWPGGRWQVRGRPLDPRENRTWVGSLPAGQEDASGLQYRRNRYYDPSSGQFTQQDPIGIAGGLNLYGYANGDPVNFSDPFGLTACDDPPCRTLALTLGVGGSLQVFAQGLTVSASVGLRLSVRHPQVFMQFDGGMGMGMGLYVGGGTQVGLQTMTVNPETDLIEDGNSVGVFGQGNLGAGESVGLTGSATLDSSGTVNAGANGSFRYGGGIGAGVMAGATVSHVEASRSLWDILKESAQRFTSTFITGEHD